MPVTVAGVQPGPARQAARAEWTVQRDQFEAVQIDVPELQMRAHLVVEQRKLVAQRTQ
jgi:hypothetical protein